MRFLLLIDQKFAHGAFIINVGVFISFIQIKIEGTFNNYYLSVFKHPLCCKHNRFMLCCNGFSHVTCVYHVESQNSLEDS